MPKLESLENLLRSLGVGMLERASTLALIDERAARLGGGGRAGEVPAGLLLGGDLLPERIQAAFGSVLRDLLALHGRSVQRLLFRAEPARDPEPSSGGP